ISFLIQKLRIIYGAIIRLTVRSIFTLTRRFNIQQIGGDQLYVVFRQVRKRWHGAFAFFYDVDDVLLRIRFRKIFQLRYPTPTFTVGCMAVYTSADEVDISASMFLPVLRGSHWRRVNILHSDMPS